MNSHSFGANVTRRQQQRGVFLPYVGHRSVWEWGEGGEGRGEEGLEVELPTIFDSLHPHGLINHHIFCKSWFGKC